MLSLIILLVLGGLLYKALFPKVGSSYYGKVPSNADPLPDLEPTRLSGGCNPLDPAILAPLLAPDPLRAHYLLDQDPFAYPLLDPDPILDPYDQDDLERCRDIDEIIRMED
jgi:hypothetical protein